MLSECERVREECKTAIDKVNQNWEVLKVQYVAKVKALETQYAEKEEQMRLMKYKEKC